jgi:hypothetical protein
LSFLVGHCWTGAAPGGAGVDQHCFEPVYGGQHVRDRHVVTVDGKPVYEGETVYSAEGGRLTFTYWNSIGGLGRGSVVVAGDMLRFSGTIHARPSASDAPFAVTWRKLAGSYEVSDGDGAPPRSFRRD